MFYALSMPDTRDYMHESLDQFIAMATVIVPNVGDMAKMTDLRHIVALSFL